MQRLELRAWNHHSVSALFRETAQSPGRARLSMIPGRSKPTSDRRLINDGERFARPYHPHGNF